METKGISLNEIRSRCAQFVVDWRDSAGDERQDAQSFVRDLLLAYGISETKAALYEKRVERSSTGNQGYIDALVPGILLIEMKSKGKNLEQAERQALDYLQNLPEAEVPQYVLTSDFKYFRILDLHAPTGSDVVTFDLEQLVDRAESLAFLAGYKSRIFGSVAQEEASVKAAKLMGNLYEALEGSGYSEHESSVFLVRSLFALYADDSGLWQKDLFTEFISTRTSPDGSDLGSQLTLLFQVMNQPQDKRMSTLDELLLRFPYVNGGLFEERLAIPAFTKRMRDQLVSACDFNWSAISPAIFGSLFQSIKSPEARRELGEHYTTESNILKVIEPLFLDELKSDFDKVQNDQGGLKKLRVQLSQLRIIDPACGCGNFLVVTYRELRSLELMIISRLQELGDKNVVPTLFFERSSLAVKLTNIFGIELEEWPARIAQIALLLTEHQSNKEMELKLGSSPTLLPIEKMEGIRIANALRLDWNELFVANESVVIVGNPPFIGHQTKNPGQVDDLKFVWGSQYDGYLDYVTAWFKKAIDYFSKTTRGRFAFVSTNSISQGQPVGALFRPIFESGWRIRFAHQAFAWDSEAPGAANVHCVVIGFDKGESSPATLFVYPTPKSSPVQVEATQINGYLLDAPAVFVDKRGTPLAPDLPKVNFGTMPIDGGNLIVESSDYVNFLEDEVASKFLRRFVGSRELVNNLSRYCLWLEDVASDDLKKSSLLRQRVEASGEFRRNSSKSGDAYKFRDTPHLFRPNSMRPKVEYVCFPRVVSENRRFFTVAYFDPSVIASDAVFTAEDADGFVFAIASSSMFITWQKFAGGRLESRLRFSNTVVWNNLPLPKVSESSRSAIILAGREILSYRGARPNESLADLYDPLAMNPDLLKLHATLDKAVDLAFGAIGPLSSNEGRLDLLLKNYRSMSEANFITD